VRRSWDWDATAGVTIAVRQFCGFRIAGLAIETWSAVCFSLRTISLYQPFGRPATIDKDILPCYIGGSVRRKENCGAY
jgi:hypothetical protein